MTLTTRMTNTIWGNKYLALITVLLIFFYAFLFSEIIRIFNPFEKRSVIYTYSKLYVETKFYGADSKTWLKV